MKKVDAHLADYAAYHATKGNVACHFIGIPLIVFGLLSMLGALGLATLSSGFVVTAAELLVVAAGAYYLTLDLKLGLAMILASSALDALAHAAANVWVGLAAFLLGWVFQGIGHARYEKKAPAFLRNMVHLLVGPLFLLNEVLHVRPAGLAEEARP